MLSKKEIRNWLLKNCIDDFGNLDLSGLDFSEFNGDVIISGMEVKGSLFQGHQKVGRYLFQDDQIVGVHLIQNNQKVKGDIYQNNQSAQKVFQDKNCNSILDNEEKKNLEKELRPYRYMKISIEVYLSWRKVNTRLIIRIGEGKEEITMLLPCYDTNCEMYRYQKMEPNKQYTLKELGLFENN